MSLKKVSGVELDNYKKFWENPIWDSKYKRNLSENDKIAGLSRFWMEVKYNFAFFDQVPDLNWDKLYFEYMSKVKRTKSTFEYYQVLQELCAKLKDGHTNIYPPKELHKLFYSRPSIKTALIGNKVVVTKVKDSKLKKACIKRVFEITHIDNIPVKKYAEKHILPYISASTQQDLIVKTYDYKLLSGKENSSVALKFRNIQGERKEHKVKRKFSKNEGTKQSILDFNILDGNIGHLILGSFGKEDVVTKFKEVFPKIKGTNALIIDLRTNGGGNSDFAHEILSHFTDKPVLTSSWKTPKYMPSYRAWAMFGWANWIKGEVGHWHVGESETFKPKKSKWYSKEVILLISPETFSAAEDFSVAFKYMKRGKVIGEPTGGSTGQPLTFNLPGGGKVIVCTKRDTYPDGKDFVGIGVLPDVKVAQSWNDFVNDRDVVLERAKRILSKDL